MRRVHRFDTWGDHFSVTLTEYLISYYMVTTRFGDQRHRSLTVWWPSAVRRYEQACDNVDLLVESCVNGIPDGTSWN